MNETQAAIKRTITVDGFIVFQKVKEESYDRIQEVHRTVDIIDATNKADTLCRAYPGIEFILYSGLTGKWYSYFKPIKED
ncbi:MAG TPA: hypothetical protein VN039_12915 [Nitrospira sp.]|nr:hypothetical protein [Nitrospira sp.]